LGVAFWEEADLSGQIPALPPAILIKFISLDYFYALAGKERYLVFVLWDKVVSGINIFDHKVKPGVEMSERKRKERRVRKVGKEKR
jgi:hypothetical protein